MAKFMDQEAVTNYALLCADIKKLEARKEKLREEILADFKAGLKCPRRGPYLLSVTYQDRKQISWKDEFVKLAKEQLGKAWVKYRMRIENEAEVTKVPMLLTDVNPDFDAVEKTA